METLLYLAKINLFLVIFYGCYWLLFRNHTFFAWNRFYLLASLAASLLLPLIKFSETYQVNMSDAPADFAAVPTQTPIQHIQDQTFDWITFFALIYGIGITIMLGRLILSFYKIFETIKNGERLPLEDHTLVLLGKQTKTANTGSFSFFKWLVVSKTDYEDNPDVILRHEHVHIRQLHSLDVIFVEFLKVFLWFNPVIWFYKRAIQEIHEFLADQQIPDRDRYANFLVSYALNVPQRILTNHFYNSSLLKSRIQMIYKNRTSNWLLGKYVLVLPITCLMIFMTAARERIPVQMPVLNNVILPKKLASQDEVMNVKGVVTNMNREPITDAIVILEGSTRGFATNKKGEFELKEVPVNGRLVVSHVQYSTSAVQIQKNVTFYKVSLAKSIEIVTASSTIKEKSSEKFENYKAGQLPESVKNPFTVVEQQPQFPGGSEALAAYLDQNLKYPELAATANVGGITILKFTVSEKGEIGDVVIMKGVGFGIDYESIRLVKNMPKWEPGVQNGKPLAMSQMIEIKFDLEKGKLKTRQGLFLEVEKPSLLPTMTDLGMYFNKFIDFSGSNRDQSSATKSDSTKQATYSANYRYVNYGVTMPAYSYKFQKKSGMALRQGRPAVKPD
ncbi:M56 family metallopeptidase [Dyadobacter luticola]|uniref:Energy transducer TonB n=1 Tax=Dyadobacter luticola TaxID=1979387 RepID=A0A5R9KPN0_9BACT|nr:M56 family metallopeptidase [Dyadobacter luticola]TLU98182.1 energy transducer TonB [Dyadobacter luticola]